ncbi:MAG: hypothetical protein ACN4GR_10425 [Arenicellales bacterium]
MIKNKLRITCLSGLLIFFSSSIGHSASPAKPEDGIHRFEDSDITVVIGTRKPEQLAAFYTGRGFNQASIDAITKKCFIFGMVDNKTFDTLWLILDDWKFYAADGSEMKRWKKSDWLGVWQKTGLSPAHQSTFGWTQLPESRDLRRYEHVGGNVAVEWKDGPFKLVATLKTGTDKSGKPRIIVVENLTCKAK